MRGSVALLVATAAVSSCSDELSFSTDDDHVYSGEIVDAEFLRARPQGSSLCTAGTTIELTLNMRHLDTRAGTITTSDGLFDNAQLVMLPALSYDRLSALEIPGDFLLSLVFLAPTQAPDLAGADAVVFVSLGQDEAIEARVLAGAGEGRRLFALYRLKEERVEAE